MLALVLRRYEDKATEEARQVAEQERQEAEEKAAEDAQRQRLERRYKRRVLREALQWLKGAARAPAEAPNRCVVQGVEKVEVESRHLADGASVCVRLVINRAEFRLPVPLCRPVLIQRAQRAAVLVHGLNAGSKGDAS